MKTILILCNSDVGLYKFRKELLESLLKEYRVFISLPHGTYINELKDLGCSFIETSMIRRGTNPFKDFKLFLSYLKILRTVNPEIVLTYTIKPNIYGGLACRFLRIPYLSNITGLGTAFDNQGLLKKLTTTLYKSAMKKANKVYFQNKDDMNYFYNEGISEERKYKLLPGSGVNLNFYQLLNYPSDEIIRFIFISRVMRQKGIEQFLDVARYMKEKYINTEFHVLGSCEEDYEEKLREMELDGIIRYHGMQNDVKPFLLFSHCTIHPSYYPEGMSNVLLESAASGRPIITTNKTGCKEIVDNNINGYICMQKNSEDLIEKVERFYNLNRDTRKQMGVNGRKKVEREFDRRKVIESYFEDIKLILG